MNRFAERITDFVMGALVLALILIGHSMAFEDELAQMTPEEFKAAQCRYYNNTLPECDEPKAVVAKND